jgi:hypothetical protein
MTTMRNLLGCGVAVAFAAGCATTPIPADKLARSQAAIATAETLNAERDPVAALHLTLAKEELATGKKYLKEADNDRAKTTLDRAEADAIASRELARAKTSRIELEKTRENVTRQQAAMTGGAQ